MAQYLCSTNADETLHGERLPVATHIRLIFRGDLCADVRDCHN